MTFNMLPALKGGLVLPPASATFLQRSNTTSNSNTYTFPAVNIGAAAADRAIICACGWSSPGFEGRPIETATIGGISATVLNWANTYKTAVQAQIFLAFVPTGTTADIVINLLLTENQSNFSFAAYRALGLTSLTPLHQLTRSTSSTAALNKRADGIAVGVACSFNTSAGFATTGFTENTDANIEAAIARMAAGLISPTSAGNSSVGFTVGPEDIAWAAASW